MLNFFLSKAKQFPKHSSAVLVQNSKEMNWPLLNNKPDFQQNILSWILEVIPVFAEGCDERAEY